MRSLHRLFRSVRIRRLFFRFVPVKYHIRPLRPIEDLEALISCAGTVGSIPPQELRACFQKEFSRKNGNSWIFLVAVESRNGRKILGFVRAMLQGRDRQWWIAGLELNPLYRRRGIGIALVQRVLASLRAAGATEAILAVNRNSRPAIALYEKLGFEIVPSCRADDSYLQMWRQLG